ncbi:hypothetical protein KIN20_006647 [Parelaphostrongylus tenuis]|uniref:Uncharacterized protein n=1 Tax=Parelaphostrongylus tenuis TaxID=148309 RepID=A0AAD5QII0_PARTN|nr:hypothetical protein KIN20_006647 [Parelaphostrongylus tenuis]
MSQYTSEQSRRPGTSGTTYLTGTDVIHYNQLLEGYLNCKQFKPLLTVSNVGDGSLLLKMDVEPFPALTSLVAEQDLRRLMEKVSSSVYGNTSTMATMSSSGDAPDDQTLQVITSPPTTPTRGYLRNTRTPPRTRTPTLEYLKGFSSARSSVGAESGTSASRHSLRVRFQRTDLGYEYKVVTAIEEHFYDDTEDNVKSSSRRARNKKSRRHSNERPSRGEIAVMIDESDLLTNPKSVSPSLLSRLNTLCEAPNKDTSNPEESVSVDFNLVKPVTNADVTCTWPSNMENNSTLHGDATFDSNQTMVAYHTWKKKQRRGDPVKSISYVVCKSISASGYFLPANLSVAKGIPATLKVDKQGNTLEFLARRRSYSYPPSCRFSPYPTPVRPAKWPSCEIGGKPSYRYSTENDILSPSSVVKVSTPIKTRDERDDQMVTLANTDVAAECIMEIPTDAVTVGQNATYSQTEPSNASPSTTEVIINGEQVLKKNSPLATRTRREIRSRKLRPRAGRRTGERVTSNDQVFSGEQSSVKMCKMEINDHLQIGDDSVLRPKLNATERRKSRMPETVGDQAEAKTRTPVYQDRNSYV